MMNTMLAKDNINIFMCEMIIFLKKRIKILIYLFSCAMQLAGS